MISIKAQVATEYLIIAGIVILLIIPITYLYVKYTSESDYAITTAKVSAIANEISKVANTAYVYGQDTQLTVDVDFPKGIESINFNGKDIIFKVRNKQGELVDIVKQAEVNLFTYGDSIPVTQGRKKIIVKSLGTQILVQIPCTNGQLVCVNQVQYPSCSGSSCGLQCQNSAWAIKLVCTSPTPTCGISSGTLVCT